MNGIKCDDVFSDCVMMKCCEHFKPHYVMLRGRCMRFEITTLKNVCWSVECDTLEFQETQKSTDRRLGTSRATCYVNRWLEENLLHPLNCTLPAMRDLRSATGYEVCSPHVVIANYRQIITAYTLQNRCDPNCDRWDQGFQYWTSVEKNLGVFRLDYEEYEEIAMLSYPGFISQIGGQLGLFLGVS
ncbi:hypothetical protein OSTOST_17661, partial [Ostertagia ostertagi]